MRLLIIDGSALLFRSFFGNSSHLTRPSDDHPVGAIFGTVQTLWRIINKLSLIGGSFSHAVAVFDTPTENHRHKIDPNYKGGRAPHPSDLERQRQHVERAFAAFGIPVVKVEGWEADDVIASYTELATDRGWRVAILSSDKDLMQLIGEGVSMWTDGAEITQVEVKEKFGVMPHQMADYLALVGDPVDGIKGADGIGAKLAAELLREYSTLNGALYYGPRHLGGKRGARLAASGEQVWKARSLTALRLDAPTPLPFDALAYQGLERGKVHEFCTEWEFHGFSQRIPLDGTVGVL